MTQTIGVLGGGQLGRMLALAGIPLGFRFVFLDPAPHSPAASLGKHIIAPFDDPGALTNLANSCDVVTYEFENIPVDSLATLGNKLRPGSNALQVSQDRLTEKEFFNSLNISTAPFRPIDSVDDLDAAVRTIGPGILKSRRFGYDGKGQVHLSAEGDWQAAWHAIGAVPAIYEGLVPFDREVSIIAARNKEGDIAFYPLIHNLHRNGILRQSIAPAVSLAPDVQQRAERLIAIVMEKFNYIGVLTIELFLLADGELVVNEMAPRVHNSGHLTIDAAVTSQFENHIRAITGLPLGNSALRSPAVMLNCIGSMPAAGSLLAAPDVHYHHYGKSDRPGRKVGHITICGGSNSLLQDLSDRVASATVEADSAGV